MLKTHGSPGRLHSRLLRLERYFAAQSLRHEKPSPKTFQILPLDVWTRQYLQGRIPQREDHQSQQVKPEVAVERLERQTEPFLRWLGRWRLPYAEDQQHDHQQSGEEGDEEERPHRPGWV